MAPHTNILVTRPAGQAQELCTAVAAKGFTVHHLPMLQVLPLAKLGPEQQRQVQDLDNYQHLIFVSANAVRYGMDCIESCTGPSFLLVWTGMPWETATARLLLPFGVEAHTPALRNDQRGPAGTAPAAAARAGTCIDCQGRGRASASG